MHLSRIKFHNNMKKAVLFVFLLLVSLEGFAGNDWAKRTWTFEVGLGNIYTPNKMFFDRVVPGLSAYAEANYNFRQIPLSVGARIQGDVFGRQINPDFNDIPPMPESEIFPSARLLLTADYHIPFNRNLSLFVGSGIGIGKCEITENLVREGKNYYIIPGEPYATEYPFSLQPRIGLLIVHSLRVSLSYTYGDKANSFFGLHAGYVF